MTYLQTTAATMSKPKVTILPPAEQDVFFQETQFEETLGQGVDPRQWEAGKTTAVTPEPTRTTEYGLDVMKARLKRAEKALEGHKNKDAIMKILRSGLND